MNWLIVVVALVSFYLGAVIGWIYAIKDIVEACKNLGAFYVKDEVFHCTKVSKFKEEE